MLTAAILVFHDGMFENGRHNAKFRLDTKLFAAYKKTMSLETFV